MIWGILQRPSLTVTDHWVLTKRLSASSCIPRFYISQFPESNKFFFSLSFKGVEVEESGSSLCPVCDTLSLYSSMRNQCSVIYICFWTQSVGGLWFYSPINIVILFSSWSTDEFILILHMAMPFNFSFRKFCLSLPCVWNVQEDLITNTASHYDQKSKTNFLPVLKRTSLLFFHCI